MSALPRDTIAMRRELGAGCAGFVVGFVAVAVAIVYAWVRFVIPEQGWWGIIDCVVRLLMFPMLGGAGVAAIIVIPLNRWHYYRGFYCCAFCGQRRKKGVPCECLPEEVRRQPRRHSKWRHYRKRIKPVLLTYGKRPPVGFCTAGSCFVRLRAWSKSMRRSSGR